MGKTTVAVLAGLVACVGPAGAQTPREGNVARVFAETCAACHGANLRGGQAGSLVDDTWKYGGDNASLARSIREGRPEAGMPPFGAALSDEDVRALVIFVRSRESGEVLRRHRSSAVGQKRSDHS